MAEPSCLRAPHAHVIAHCEKRKNAHCCGRRRPCCGRRDNTSGRSRRRTSTSSSVSRCICVANRCQPVPPRPAAELHADRAVGVDDAHGAHVGHAAHRARRGVALQLVARRERHLRANYKLRHGAGGGGGGGGSRGGSSGRSNPPDKAVVALVVVAAPAAVPAVRCAVEGPAQVTRSECHHAPLQPERVQVWRSRQRTATRGGGGSSSNGGGGGSRSRRSIPLDEAVIALVVVTAPAAVPAVRCAVAGPAEVAISECHHAPVQPERVQVWRSRQRTTTRGGGGSSSNGGGGGSRSRRSIPPDEAVIALVVVTAPAAVPAVRCAVAGPAEVARPG
jgi:uncharacterized membrane protein YgcG